MMGFWGWFLAFVLVLAVFNAEKLPALKQMLEEKFKDSVDAAKEGSKIAQAKIKQAKSDLENKKKQASVVENEENTQEEIDDALKFMGDYVKQKDQKSSAKVASNQAETDVKESKEETKTDEEQPIDLEHRD